MIEDIETLETAADSPQGRRRDDQDAEPVTGIRGGGGAFPALLIQKGMSSLSAPALISRSAAIPGTSLPTLPGSARR